MGFKPKMYDSFGKIRTRYDNDLIGFAQWVGRKIRNHDPMSERDTGRGKRTYLNQDAKPKIGEPFVAMVEHAEEPVVLYGMGDGRVYEIQVREVRPEAYAKTKLVAVGS